jgi:hypothetical protein
MADDGGKKPRGVQRSSKPNPRKTNSLGARCASTVEVEAEVDGEEEKMGRVRASRVWGGR